MGPHIADFCCPQHRFIVELDGSVHGQSSQAQSDARRDRYLKNRGYDVLRLSNGIVREAPELFVEKELRRVGSLPEVINYFVQESASSLDPLTRLAPADESAGCEPRIMKGRP